MTFQQLLLLLVNDAHDLCGLLDSLNFLNGLPGVSNSSENVLRAALLKLNIQ
jgi:hypothetical protein